MKCKSNLNDALHKAMEVSGRAAMRRHPSDLVNHMRINGFPIHLKTCPIGTALDGALTPPP